MICGQPLTQHFVAPTCWHNIVVLKVAPCDITIRLILNSMSFASTALEERLMRSATSKVKGNAAFHSMDQGRY